MFAPRWVVGHVVILIVVVSCLFLCNWQWDVSMVTHSLQNMAYAVQWPFFAVFFAVMWWRMLRLESQRLDEEEAEAGANAPEKPVRKRVEKQSAPPVDEPILAGPSRRTVADARRDTAAVEDEADPAMDAYNRMLAALAAKEQ